MSLKLYFHPLASFCQKVLIAFYENDIPFEPHLVDLGDPASRDAFRSIWPIGKMPVLCDSARDRIVPESSIIIEYLVDHYPTRMPLIPLGADLARQTRLRDRFYDLYVEEPMQKIVGDRLRPEGAHDPFGVAQARAQLRTAYDMIEHDMRSRTWAMGEAFTMADCAAAPALFYAHLVEPIGADHPQTLAYRDRLMARPSYARVLAEAEPYMKMFPAA
jgi:glutathione S-transferase